jgi:hypothetical protein
MRPCRFPSGCPREAAVTVRIASVGDRDVCREHHEWMTAQGMAFRVLEPNSFVPEWRQRSLQRDTTGRVLNVRASTR